MTAEPIGGCGMTMWAKTKNLVAVVTAAGLLFAASGCSSEGSATETPFDPAGAETCAELADMFAGSTQRMLDALGTRTDAEMEGNIPPEIQAASDEIGEWFFGSAGDRITDLCPGGSAEFESLVCEQASSFEALGEAAERHLRDNFPPCDQ